jgi:excisionase family DNA binding protein
MANDQSALQNEVMNGDEAAVFLKMPKSTLLKLCSEGQLPGVKVGRQWRFNRFALENWMRERDGEATNIPEDSVGEPIEMDFPAKLKKAETTVAREIKPVVQEMVELPNGCICCTVKDRRGGGASVCHRLRPPSFLQTLEALVTRRDRIDCILVETTGACAVSS